MKNILITFSLIISSFGVFATDFFVTSTVGNEWTTVAGSFTRALADANAAGVGPHNIIFDASLNGQTIIVNTSIPDLTNNQVTIDGLGQNITISRNTIFGPALRISGNQNIVSNLTFINNTTQIGAVSVTGDFNRVVDVILPSGGVYVGEVSPVQDDANNNIITNANISAINGSVVVFGDDNSIENVAIEGTYTVGLLSPDLPKNRNRLINSTIKGDKINPWETNAFIVNGNDNIIDMVQVLGGEGGSLRGLRNRFSNSTMFIDRQPTTNSGLDINGPASQNEVFNNTFTLNPATVVVTASTNVDGIKIIGGSNSNDIHDNIIDGNFWNGILVRTNSLNNLIRNNETHDNVNHGVFVHDGANNTLVEGNIAYNNQFSGIAIRNANNVTVIGNSVYDNTNGIAYFSIASGTSMASGNYAYRNNAGLLIESATGITFEDNIVGRDALGNLGPNVTGILLQAGSSNNNIGTTLGNTIVANTNYGLLISGSNVNSVLNNTFGNSSNTNPALENGSNAIRIENGSRQNIIGSPNSPNTIAYKLATVAAISIDGATTTRNTVEANSTFCNAGPGIQLSNGGNANYGEGVLTINRAAPVLSGLAPANANVHIYDADVNCTPLCTATSQNSLSQGQTYVTTVTADGTGYWEYPAGDETKAIINATDPVSNSSSAFSVCSFIRGCDDPENVMLTVVGGGDPEFCSGNDIDLRASSTSTGITFVYSWYLNNVLQTGLNTSLVTVNQPGTWRVTIGDSQDPNLCNNSADLAITENTNNSIISVAGPSDACDEETGLNFSLSGGTAGSLYAWSSVNSKINLTGVTTGVNITSVTGNVISGSSGTETIQVIETDANGCLSTPGETDVNIISLPTIPTIVGDQSVLCNGTANYSISSSTTGLQFDWIGPTGAVITSLDPPNNTQVSIQFGADGGNVTATPRTTVGGCTGVAPGSISVTLTGCNLQANFNTAITTPCIGSTITFTDASIADAGLNVTSWFWDFGAGATPATANTEGPHDVTYSTTGPKTVTLTVMDNGTPQGTDPETKVGVVTINQNTSNLVVSGPSNACDEETGLAFSVSGGGTGTNYTWSNPDGKLTVNNLGGIDETATTASVLSGSSGVAVVNVVERDANGCLANGSTDVDIISLPITPTINGNNPILCNAQDEIYTVSPVTPGETYTWTVPNGATFTTLNTPTNDTISVDFTTFQGRITVVGVTTTGGCITKVPAELDITLSGCGLQANFSRTDPSLCVGNTITFTDQSTEDDTNIDSWLWDFGAGATPATANTQGPHDVTYSTIGPKTVTLTITDDGTPEATSMEPKDDYFVINQNAKTLNVSGPDDACSEETGLAFTVTNPTSGLNYAWSNGANLTVNNLGGIDEVATTADLNVGATGIATIEVIETDLNGCEASGSKDVNIIEIPNIPSILGQTSALCNDENITYAIDNPVSGISYFWTVPNGASIVSSNGTDSTQITVDFGTTSGNITATPVSDVAGCIGLTPGTLSVSLTGCDLVADFSTNTTGLCVGDAVTFTDVSTVSAPSEIVEWIWDFGADAVPSTISGRGPHDVVYSTNGVKNVSLIVIDNSVPTAATDTTVNKTITINNNPAAPILSGPLSVCEGVISDYRVLNPNLLSTYDFFLNTGSFATIINKAEDSTDVLAGGEGYTIFVEETDANGCTTENSLGVSVDETINLGTIRGSSLVCDTRKKPDSYVFEINSNFINSDPSFSPWKVTPDIFSTDPLAFIVNESEDGVVNRIEINFGNSLGQVELSYAAPTPACGNDDTARAIPFVINIRESKKYDVSIISDTVCVGDDNEYGVLWTIDGVDFSGRFKNFTYLWKYNDDTLAFTSDTANVTNHQLGDSLSVRVSFPDTLCFTPASDTNYLYDPLDVVDRPGADLWADEFEEGFRQNIEEQNILLLNDQSDVYLFDRTNRSFATTQDLVDFYDNWNFSISRVLRNADQNGMDSLHFVENRNPKQTDPFLYGIDALPNQDTTTYKLLVSNGICWDSSEVKVIIDFQIFIPNVFTPNGDATYETWEIKNIDRFPNNKVTVYNRWGGIVYDEQGYNNTTVLWEGEKNGEELPFGTYYYIVDLGNGAEPFSGYVSIMK